MIQWLLWKLNSNPPTPRGYKGESIYQKGYIEMEKNRKCTNCSRILPLNKDNFHSVKTRVFNGFTYRCRSCEKLRDKLRTKNSKARVVSNRKRTKRYQENNQDKIIARITLRRAVSAGVIKKDECSMANISDCCFGKIEAHHDDYNRPLDVRWLCKYHHTKQHYKTP